MVLYGQVTDYSGKIKTYEIRTNCYHVSIERDDKTVFHRGELNSVWLDPKHRAIADALNNLERALIAATK